MSQFDRFIVIITKLAIIIQFYFVIFTEILSLDVVHYVFLLCIQNNLKDGMVNGALPCLWYVNRFICILFTK